ncbi:MAG: trypsin-like serine protease [Acidimicrobiales bacterium]
MATPRTVVGLVIAATILLAGACASEGAGDGASGGPQADDCDSSVRLGDGPGWGRFVIVAEGGNGPEPTATAGWVVSDDLIATAGSELRTRLESGAAAYARSSTGEESRIVEAFIDPANDIVLVRPESALPAPLPVDPDSTQTAARARVESSLLTGEPLFECGFVVAIAMGPVSGHEADDQVGAAEVMKLVESVEAGEVASVPLPGGSAGVCPDPAPYLEIASASTFLIVAESSLGQIDGVERSSFATLGTAFAVRERLLVTNGHLVRGLLDSEAQLTNVYAIGADGVGVVEVARAFVRPGQDPARATDLGLLATLEPVETVLALPGPESEELAAGQDVWIVGFGRGSGGDLVPVIPGQTAPAPTPVEVTLTGEVVFSYEGATGTSDGSPVVACGSVVGVNNSGVERLLLLAGAGTGGLEVETIRSGIGPAVTQIGAVESLLALFDDQSLEGVPIPVPHATAGPPATIEFIDCPEEFVAEQDNFCTVSTNRTVGGEWEIPGFTTTPVILQTINGPNTIRVNPKADSIGQRFTITVVVNGTDGAQARATHGFIVVD